MLTPEQKKELLVLLEKEAEDIRKVLSGFAKKHAHAPEDYESQFPQMPRQSGDISEGAYSVEEYENRLALEHSLEARLKEVDGAIADFKKEAYGQCKKCGKEMLFERLKANPAAKFCAECIKKTK